MPRNYDQPGPRSAVSMPHGGNAKLPGRKTPLADHVSDKVAAHRELDEFVSSLTAAACAFTLEHISEFINSMNSDPESALDAEEEAYVRKMMGAIVYVRCSR